MMIRLKEESPCYDEENDTDYDGGEEIIMEEGEKSDNLSEKSEGNNKNGSCCLSKNKSCEKLVVETATTALNNILQGQGAAAAESTTKMIQCDICFRTFSQAANMRRHRLRHSGIRPYGCRVCSKSFYRKDHLDEHMFTHSRKCPQCCPICGKCFFRQSHLKNHILQEHPGTSTLKKLCDICGFQAPTLYDAQMHATTHQDQGTTSPVEMGDPSGNNNPSKQVNLSSPDTSGGVQALMMVPEVCLDEDEVESEVSNQGSCCRNEGGNNISSSSLLNNRCVETSTTYSAALTCPHCGINFPDQILYFLHKGVHSEGEPWRCNICGTLCRDKYDFNTHILSEAHS